MNSPSGMKHSQLAAAPPTFIDVFGKTRSVTPASELQHFAP